MTSLLCQKRERLYSFGYMGACFTHAFVLFHFFPFIILTVQIVKISIQKNTFSNYLFLNPNFITWSHHEQYLVSPKKGLAVFKESTCVLEKVHSLVPGGKQPCFLIPCNLSKYLAAKKQHVEDIIKCGWFRDKKVVISSNYDVYKLQSTRKL